MAFIGSQAAVAAEYTPGSAPPQSFGTPPAGARTPEAASGLKVFYRKYGYYELSVDAKGSNDASHKVKVYKPHKNAKVVKAYLMAATYNSSVIANGDIKLRGRSVSWFSTESNSWAGGTFYSHLADVTSFVKNKIDGMASAGTLGFKIEELVNNSGIDGEILVVVFENRRLPEKRTVALMFGGQQLTGDRFEITLRNPIDKSDKNAVAKMGLGISYGYQGTGQYSIVDVNSERLTTSAGGQDDGDGFNGALITVGGIGDKTKNPPDPFATPTGPRDDDELYDLKPFLKKTTKVIYIDTVNPSDDDNIFFSWFELSSKGDINKDTDGDGLLDTWEKDGYDHDGDGKVDVPLPKWGANWKKKDIFICYAWMEKSASETKSHKPKSAVLDAVRKAFAKSPVSNPDGTKGINVHFRNFGSVPHDDDLNPVWDQFDALMNPLISEAKRKVCHRMLNAHAYGGGSSSGLSRGIPASDFIESLGKFSSNPGTNLQRAGTIMHELGHNLGLRHGGPDHENYKPNHLSIMSYFNQLGGLIYKGKPRLDYERYDIKNLDETALNEKRGLDRVGGDSPLKKYGVRFYSCGASATSKNANSNKRVDWNNNGNPTDNPIVCNLNNANSTTTLLARYPEWANIVYDGGDVGPGKPAEELNMVTSAEDLKELTYEEYLRMFPDEATQE